MSNYTTLETICQEILTEGMGGIPTGVSRSLKNGVTTPLDTPVSQAYRKAVIGTPGFNGYDQALGNGKFAYEQEESTDINSIIKDLENELDSSTMDGRSGLLVLGKLRKRLKL